MSDSSLQQLRFAPIAEPAVRGDFDGAALSSDCSALVLRDVDRYIAFTKRLAAQPAPSSRSSLEHYDGLPDTGYTFVDP